MYIDEHERPLTEVPDGHETYPQGTGPVIETWVNMRTGESEPFIRIPITNGRMPKVKVNINIDISDTKPEKETQPMNNHPQPKKRHTDAGIVLALLACSFTLGMIPLMAIWAIIRLFLNTNAHANDVNANGTFTVAINKTCPTCQRPFTQHSPLNNPQPPQTKCPTCRD